LVLSPGSKLGTYEILAPLGEGGMGKVYRARDLRLGREVAVKVLTAERLDDEDSQRRFAREARAASSLNHPYVVTSYEIEAEDGLDFIVMEYIRGRSLNQIIPKQGMPVAEVLRIAVSMADALSCAHAAGIVHRDIKPSNVMLNEQGTVKILDFGLAKIVPQTSKSVNSAAATADLLSRAGMVVGTVGYMSPEQATGREVDSRSDVFSLGAILYEMVTGRRAFSGTSKEEVQASLIKDSPKAPSEIVADVPKELERLILRCLRKEPERRFQHMVDVKVDLEEIMEESSSRRPLAAVPSPRHRSRWPTASIVGILALAVAIWAFWPRSPIPPPIVVRLTSTPGRETQPTFSPDGNQIAFAWAGEQSDNWDIYLQMVGSSETRRLTTDPAVDQMPSWAPDGAQIAFIRTTRENEAGKIHLVSPLGGSDRTLSNAETAFGRLSWSPDGRWLATAANAFGPEPRSEIRGIRLIGVPGGEVRSITSPSAITYHTDPAFSPNGSHLAYASCVSFYSCQIDVLDLGPDYAPKGAAHRVTRTTFCMGGLTWTRDGKSVVYNDRSNGRLWRVGIGGDQPPERIEVAGSQVVLPTAALSKHRLAFEQFLGHKQLYRFEAGSEPRITEASSDTDWNPHFSPDGRRFAWNRGGEIWLASADGSNPVQLTHGPGHGQGSPRWSPDSRHIVFDSYNEDLRLDVWTIDADGASLRHRTEDPGDEYLPSWSRDGRWIYFTSNRGGFVPDIWRAPAMGGPQERITHNGGSVPYESIDGKTLFFIHEGGSSPLMALPLAGGSERKVIDCVPAPSGYAIGSAGVYHFGCGADRAAVPLYLRDLGTGRDRLLGTFENGQGGLTVSPDGKTIIYSRIVGEGSDLMMIENFR
jgi:serine/threonine protein kinase